MLKNNTVERLNKLGFLLVERVKRQLKIEKLYATGKFYDSLSHRVEQTEESLSLIVSSSENYAKYIIDGRPPGKRPPYSKIAEWARAKKIQPREFSTNKSSKFGSIERFDSMVYNIQKAIGEKGTIKRFAYGGSKFLDFALNSEAISKITKEISEGYLKDLNNELGKNVNKKTK